MIRAHRWLPFALIAAGMLCSRPVGAQLALLHPGAQVRLDAGTRLEGTISQRSDDSVTVALRKGGSQTFALASLNSAFVNRGKSASAGAVRGLLWGGGVGLTLAVVTLSSASNCNTGTIGDGLCAGFVGAAALVELVGGSALGAMIGGAVGRDRWDRVRLPGEISLAPFAGRQGAGISIRF